MQQEKLNEQRAEYKVKIGKAIRKRNFYNLYGDPKRAEIAVAVDEIAGHTLSSATQTLTPQKVDAAMQTEAAHLSPLENNQALIMLDTGDVQVMQTLPDPLAMLQQPPFTEGKSAAPPLQPQQAQENMPL